MLTYFVKYAAPLFTFFPDSSSPLSLFYFSLSYLNVIYFWFCKDVLIDFFKLFIYLFLERAGGREKEREEHQCVKETSISCLSTTPYWGPGLQPRHVPWLELEPATFWFTGYHSIHWATLARAVIKSLSLFWISTLLSVFPYIVSVSDKTMLC